MKEYNIELLIDASSFSKDLPDKVKDALLQFFIDCDFTLDTINVDDVIVNSLTYKTKDEFAKYFKEDDMQILFQDDDGYWFFQ